ncbi:MAG: putative DNA binding domain-containing protein [Candidatus Riflebacteria bacterium]|nr:putative DNA binding domain-containing protein [Candidatus Riflebacteria bacterium]
MPKRTVPLKEDRHTEFKRWPVHADDLAAALVAFANTDGGQLFLGVDDSGRALGLANIDEALKLVDNVARNNCLPPLTVVARTVKVAGKAIVIVRVPRGDQLPYHTNRGVCFVRGSAGRRHASREELLRMFQRAESLYFDEMLVQGASLADLDGGAIETFLISSFSRGSRDFGVPYSKLLANLRLARGDCPTVAGLLLFGRNPQQFLPCAQVNAACMPGRDLVEAPLDRKDLSGQLAAIIDSTYRFVELHLRRPHVIRGVKPEPRPEIPPEAFREAIVNALVHRDYTIRGPVRLLIFVDRVEVHSPGRPPNGVDVESMVLGTHIPRNPILLSHLAKLGFVTSIGSGIPRILALVRESTGRDASIEVRSNETVVILPRPARRPSRVRCQRSQRSDPGQGRPASGGSSSSPDLPSPTTRDPALLRPRQPPR